MFIPTVIYFELLNILARIALINLVDMRALGQHNGNIIYSVTEPELPAIMLDTAISAGFPSPAQDYQEEEIDLVKIFNLTSPTVFIIRVAGDSMRDAHILNKSLIAVDRKIKPEHRHLIVATINGEFTIKRFLKTDAGYMLHPENPTYTPILIQEEDDFRVWGVITRIFIDPNLYL